MNSEDWRMVGSIGAILGFIFLGGGAWIWLNVEGYNGWRGIGDYYEYRGYSAPLIIAGVSFLVIGIAFQGRSQTLNTTKTRSPPNFDSPNEARRFCINCGTEIPINAKYCPSCGQKT